MEGQSSNGSPTGAALNSQIRQRLRKRSNKRTKSQEEEGGTPPRNTAHKEGEEGTEEGKGGEEEQPLSPPHASRGGSLTKPKTGSPKRVLPPPEGAPQPYPSLAKRAYPQPPPLPAPPGAVTTAGAVGGTSGVPGGAASGLASQPAGAGAGAGAAGLLMSPPPSR